MLNYNLYAVCNIYAELLSSSYQETFLSGCSEILPELILFTLEKCSGRSVRVCPGLPNYQIRMVAHGCLGVFMLVLLSLLVCIHLGFWFLVLGWPCAIGVKPQALKLTSGFSSFNKLLICLFRNHK